MFNKIYKYLCHVKEEGDDDGISKPMSEVLSKSSKAKSDPSSSQSTSKIQKKKFVSIKHENLSDEIDNRNTSPSTHDLDAEVGAVNSAASPTDSIGDLDNHVEKFRRRKSIVFNTNEEEEVHEYGVRKDLAYGKTLLDKQKLERDDILEIFS